jgi:ssDNA-binding Zn-finger/Zn-ribbon topoisomerase 1
MILRESKFGRFYGCRNWPHCDGTVSIHEDGRPMGTPANKETRQARRRAHKVFDQLWTVHGWKRAAAYAWMAKRLGLTKEEAHIGRLDREQCERLVEIVERKVKG